MRWREGLAAVFLLAALLACNLSSPGGRPTARPTATIGPGGVALQPTIQTTGQGSTASGITGTGGTGGCTPRADWPTITIGEGDTLYGIALRVGSTVDELAVANCLSDPGAIMSGQTLRVPTVPAGSAQPTLAPGSENSGPLAPLAPSGGEASNCGGNQWFFSFDFSASESSCPGPVITGQAVGQNFQGGRVLWYEAAPGSGDRRGTLYVIYNDHTWQSFPDTWEEGQPASDPSIVPPANWYQPERGIGKLWREQPGVREKLGWAYAPEASYQGRQQSPVTESGYIYIDHGLRNLVLRLSSAGNRWETVGRY